MIDAQCPTTSPWAPGFSIQQPPRVMAELLHKACVECHKPWVFQILYGRILYDIWYIWYTVYYITIIYIYIYLCILYIYTYYCILLYIFCFLQKLYSLKNPWYVSSFSILVSETVICSRSIQKRPAAVKVYVTANAVVEREALPYVYIHEIVGDSCLVLTRPGKAAMVASGKMGVYHRKMGVYEVLMGKP